MKKLTLTYFIAFLWTFAFGQFKPKGAFIGVEKMEGYVDSENPKHIWYHLSVLTFKDDSAFLEQSPVAIYKNDTIFSASDGGFYYYAGTIGQYEGKAFLDLKLRSCDYCPTQSIRFKPPKILKDDDTTQDILSDTAVTEEDLTNEYPNRKYKIMILQKTKNNDIIIVNKNIYRRQKRK